MNTMTAQTIERIRAAHRSIDSAINEGAKEDASFDLADACNFEAMTAVLAHIDAQAAEIERLTAEADARLKDAVTREMEIEKANAVMDAYLVARLEDAKEIERLRGELHQHECNNFDAVREQRDFLLASQSLLIESANYGQDEQSAEIARLTAEADELLKDAVAREMEIERLRSEIESLRWTVKDALESLDNNMDADCRATLIAAMKGETP